MQGVYQIDKTEDGDYIVVVSTFGRLHGFVTGRTALACREWIKAHFGRA